MSKPEPPNGGPSGAPTSRPRLEPTGRPRLEPPDPPMVPFVLAGLGLWAIAGLILVAIRPTLAAHGHQNWIWICVAGFLLGIPGLALMLVRDARQRRRRTSTGR